jgi:hypothetical protein
MKGAEGTTKVAYWYPGIPRVYKVSTADKIKEITISGFRQESTFTRLLEVLYPTIILGEYDPDPTNETRISRSVTKSGEEIPTTLQPFCPEIQLNSAENRNLYLEFLFRCTHELANSTPGFHVTYLDCKPKNVGVLPDGTLRCIDAGAAFTYSPPDTLSDYFQCAGIIIGLFNMGASPFNDEELTELRKKITYAKMIECVRFELNKAQRDEIRAHARRFFSILGLEQLSDIAHPEMPGPTMSYYCLNFDENRHVYHAHGNRYYRLLDEQTHTITERLFDATERQRLFHIEAHKRRLDLL